MSQNYQVIGTRPIRHDGIDKVTGRALYGADFQAAGTFAGKTLITVRVVEVVGEKKLAFEGSGEVVELAGAITAAK